MAEDCVSVLSSDELLAWAYVLRAVGSSRRQFAALIAEVGVVAVAEALRDGVIGESSSAAWDLARRDVDAAVRIDARLVVPGGTEWPSSMLAALSEAGGPGSGGVPLALWVRGPHRLNDVVASAISISGTRASSSYGEYVTASIAAGIVEAGRAVVAGAAYGVDGIAHRAAMQGAGVTVAVLPCGIGRAYPSGHATLLDVIAHDGLVVSEYAPDVSPSKLRFVARSRLVAALSRALVITEAGRRSGAATTVQWARAVGRPVGAVPGPVTSAVSVGCHHLIAEGAARLVTSAADVVGLLTEAAAA